MGNQMVTWTMTSRVPIGRTCDPKSLRAQYLDNAFVCSTVSYPSDSLASCIYMLVKYCFIWSKYMSYFMMMMMMICLLCRWNGRNGESSEYCNGELHCLYVYVTFWYLGTKVSYWYDLLRAKFITDSDFLVSEVGRWRGVLECCLQIAEVLWGFRRSWWKQEVGLHTKWSFTFISSVFKWLSWQ